VGAGVLVGTLGTFASNVLIPHILPIDDAANYFVASSSVMILAITLRLGLDRSIVRVVSEAHARRDPEAAARSVRAAIIIFAVVSTVAFTALVLGLWRLLAGTLFGSPRLADMAVLIAVWTVLEAVRLVLSESLRGSEHVLCATVLGNAGRAAVLTTLLLLLLRANAPNLHAAILLSTAASALLFVLSLGAVFRVFRVRRSSKAHLRLSIDSLVRSSLPFYVTSLWGFVGTQGDVLLAGILLTKHDVAYYAAASKLSQVLSLPMVALVLFLSPSIPRLLASGDLIKLESRIRTASTLIALPVVAVTLFILVANKLVIQTVYPAQYEAAGPILAILALGPLSTAISGPNGATLLMTHHAGSVARSTAIVTTAQLVGMVVGALGFGAYGLAIASSAGSIILNSYYSVLVRRRVGIATEPYLSRSRLVSCGQQLRAALRSGNS